MKVNLTLAMVVLIVAGLAVGAVAGFTIGQAQSTANSSHHSCDEQLLQAMPAALGLDVTQQERLRRISDRVHHQFVSIKQDTREKTRAVMDAAVSEIVPVLTPEQQKKLNDLQRAREDMHRAREKFHSALKISSAPPF